MPIRIIRQDITKIKCDAIVNPTDVNYSHCGGVDKAIHEAAGVALYHACTEQGQLSVGKSVITPAFDLPCKYVIHTVGPRWRDGVQGEEMLLRSCYEESLKLAAQNKCKSVAIPLISSGKFGFPKDRVLRLAMDAIGSFLFDNEMLVYIVVYDKTSYSISERLFSNIVEYIDDHYVDGMICYSSSFMCMEAPMAAEPRAGRRKADRNLDSVCKSVPVHTRETLDEQLKRLDESFSEMLLRKIDESGMTDAECYKKANIDRKLFSKIRSDKEYRPSKNTVLAFAIALRLPLDEVRDMLSKAGFALSHSNKFDIIVEYFIVRGQYDLFAINETLLAFDQKLLGM